MLILPKQLRKYFSVNYIAVLNNILKQFGIISKWLGYFITNNTINNNAYIRELSTIYTFNKKDKRIWCSRHILNYIAQLILFSKDKEAFKNL